MWESSECVAYFIHKTVSDKMVPKHQINRLEYCENEISFKHIYVFIRLRGFPSGVWIEFNLTRDWKAELFASLTFSLVRSFAYLMRTRVFLKKFESERARGRALLFARTHTSATVSFGRSKFVIVCSWFRHNILVFYWQFMEKL